MELSRRSLLGLCGATGSGFVAGCAGLGDSTRSTTTAPGEATVDLRYVSVKNWTDDRHEADVTLYRDGESVFDQTVVVRPYEKNEDNAVVQGTKLLHGEYLHEVADYRFEFGVGEKTATSEVTREDAYVGDTDEDYCFGVVGRIYPSEDDYHLRAVTYVGEGECLNFDDG